MARRCQAVPATSAQAPWARWLGGPPVQKSVEDHDAWVGRRGFRVVPFWLMRVTLVAERSAEDDSDTKAGDAW